MNCPNCKSENIKCYKKKQTDSQAATDNEILCVCQDCGYKYKRVRRPAPRREAPTRDVSGRYEPGRKVQRRAAPLISPKGEIQPKGVLRWIFLILLWPVALSVWFYNTNKVKIEKTIKAIIIALAWLVVTGVTAWLLFKPVYNIPEIVFDRTVTDKRDVSTAQFASTTAGATKADDKKDDSKKEDETKAGEVSDATEGTTAQTTKSIFS